MCLYGSLSRRATHTGYILLWFDLILISVSFSLYHWFSIPVTYDISAIFSKTKLTNFGLFMACWAERLANEDASKVLKVFSSQYEIISGDVKCFVRSTDHMQTGAYATGLVCLAVSIFFNILALIVSTVGYIHAKTSRSVKFCVPLYSFRLWTGVVCTFIMGFRVIGVLSIIIWANHDYPRYTIGACLYLAWISFAASLANSVIWLSTSCCEWCGCQEANKHVNEELIDFDSRRQLEMVNQSYNHNEYDVSKFH